MAHPRVNPRALAELYELLVRAVYSQAYAAGLNPAQWWALRYIARADEGARLPSALAESYLAGKSTVSQTIGCLVTKGLVVKERDLRDGRARRLRLTAAGRAMLQRDPIEQLVGAIGALRPRQQLDAAAIVETLVQRLFATRTDGCPAMRPEAGPPHRQPGRPVHRRGMPPA